MRNVKELLTALAARMLNREDAVWFAHTIGAATAGDRVYAVADVIDGLSTGELVLLRRIGMDLAEEADVVIRERMERAGLI